MSGVMISGGARNAAAAPKEAWAILHMMVADEGAKALATELQAAAEEYRKLVDQYNYGSATQEALDAARSAQVEAEAALERADARAAEIVQEGLDAANSTKLQADRDVAGQKQALAMKATALEKREAELAEREAEADAAVKNAEQAQISCAAQSRVIEDTRAAIQRKLSKMHAVWNEES